MIRPQLPGPWAAVLLALLAAPAATRANGRFPAAQHVLIGPAGQSRTIALRTTFGFVVSDDSGASFHWLCEDLLGYGGPFDPPFALDARGSLHAGLFDGLARTREGRCGVDRDPALEGHYVVDLDQSADGSRLYALSSDGTAGAVNRLYLSRDGAAYAPVGAGLAGVLFETFEIARSQPQRVYVTGTALESGAAVFYRSDDGGLTLREFPLPARAGLVGAFIAGIDPVRADTVYLRAVLRQANDAGAPTGSPTALLRSTDGGGHWTEVARTISPMLGFAIDERGTTLWYGSADPREGLHRSDDSGTSFRAVAALPVLCLRHHAKLLYVCSDDPTTGFALGRSSDKGESIEPLLRFGAVAGPPPCPRGSVAHDVCAPRWPAVRRGFGASDGGPVDATVGSASAHGGCGCAAVPARPVPWWMLGALAIVAGAWRRRAR